MNIKPIKSDKAPAAIGPYSQAVRCGDFIFASGMLPIDMKTGELETASIEKACENVFNNIGELLKSEGLSFTNVVKTTVFMTDLSEFAAMNKVYESFFKDTLPARSTIQAAALPKGAKLEIEITAYAGK